MRVIFLFGGIAILAICLVMPFSAFYSSYPFSRHMIDHTGLQLVAAPLFALAIPVNNRFKKALVWLSGVDARYPVLPWLIGVSMMWIWHWPVIYRALPMVGMGTVTIKASLLSILHPLCLLLGGFLFCWPLVTPYKTCRLAVLPAVLYLGTACVFCSLLGLLIAFAPPATFGHVSAADKQIGGLIMWVPCCVLYLAACMFLLINWLSFKEEIKMAKSSNC